MISGVYSCGKDGLFSLAAYDPLFPLKFFSLENLPTAHSIWPKVCYSRVPYTHNVDPCVASEGLHLFFICTFIHSFTIHSFLSPIFSNITRKEQEPVEHSAFSLSTVEHFYCPLRSFGCFGKCQFVAF